MKIYLVRLSLCFTMLFAVSFGFKKFNNDAKAGWGIAAAIAYSAGADDEEANFWGNVGGAFVGGAAAYEGGMTGAAIGSVGGPLGAAVGGALGFL